MSRLPTGRLRHRYANRTEQGAVALMVAMSLVAMLVGVGMVLDFGIIRYESEINKSVADAAVTAGALALDPGDGDYHPWTAVCTALAYLQSNDPQLATMTGTYMDGSGSPVAGTCTGASGPNDVGCVAGTPSTWAWYAGTIDSGRITVDIKSAYVTPDPAFPSDQTVPNDNGTHGGCDQVAVIITQKEKPGLGSLATSSDLVTRIRSVGRSVPNPAGVDKPVALLLLERHDCNALAIGSNNAATAIDVQGTGIYPGSIHSDSLGDGVSGSNLCNASGTIFYGKHPGGIIAEAAPVGGAPGVITANALSGAPGAVPSRASDGSANVCAEQSYVAPPSTPTNCGTVTGRSLIGRYRVDKRYLGGVKTAVTNAAAAYNLTASQAASAGYTVWTPANCAGSGLTTSMLTPAAASALKLYVNCPAGVSINNLQISNATTVVFNSSVLVKSGSYLRIPLAQFVYVRGYDTSSSTGVNAQGTLSLNIGASAPAPPLAANYCSASRTLPTTPRDQLVIGTGPLTGGAQGVVHLCSTAVLLADGWFGPALGPTGCAPPGGGEANPGPAPADNPCGGSVNLGGGAGVDWTASDQVQNAQASPTDWANLEDLALWTESSGTGTQPQNSIGGGSAMNVGGVFMLPNANPFLLSGQGTQNNGLNAQFISRRLVCSGQGALYMKPNPFDTITLPPPGIDELVR